MLRYLDRGLLLRSAETFRSHVSASAIAPLRSTLRVVCFRCSRTPPRAKEVLRSFRSPSATADQKRFRNAFLIQVVLRRGIYVFYMSLRLQTDLNTLIELDGFWLASFVGCATSEKGSYCYILGLRIPSVQTTQKSLLLWADLTDYLPETSIFSFGVH